MSPSNIPASIILSPTTFKINISLLCVEVKCSGSGKYSSIFSTAVIGTPAVTLPITGTCIVSSTFTSSNCSLTISIALGLVGSLLIYPFSSNLDKCPCTVELEAKPTASPISRTLGG